VEPLSKYDEGAILFREQEQQYRDKLAQGVTMLGLTKCTFDGKLDWTSCTVLKADGQRFLV
jgi:hypothetical protein